MNNFVELETSDGVAMFRIMDISYVRSTLGGKQAVLHLKNGDTYTIVEEYESVVGMIQWIDAGCPELEHSEECGNCDSCGGNCEEKEEEKLKDN